jgi:hypothetical protein
VYFPSAARLHAVHSVAGGCGSQATAVAASSQIEYLAIVPSIVSISSSFRRRFGPVEIGQLWSGLDRAEARAG